jgi:uncharacterized membrane protein YeaQ/YmgE (transglycosylase-associated protein family)
MTEREREVIVTTDRGSRGGGMIVAVILGILGILLAIWLFMNLGGGDADVIPDEVNVTIDTPESGGGEG